VLIHTFLVTALDLRNGSAGDKILNEIRDLMGLDYQLISGIVYIRLSGYISLYQV
jgi:hypothetical protein